MAQPIFNRFSLVIAQNEKLARRFGDLGARNVTFAANIKNDAPPPPVDTAACDRLAAAIASRPVFCAASTHEGEDAIIAGVHRRLASEVSGLLTIIAPRHPERGAAIAEIVRGLGLATAQRSDGALPGSSTDVYIVDTIGELGLLYSLCPIAFIGGSLVERGGQNPIEAVRLGAGVLTGPHWHNFRDCYATLLRHKGAVEVKGGEDLAATVKRLLADPAELARLRAGAETALQTLGGGLAQTIKAIEPYLPRDKTESLRRAS
jgi:3-deoxy-D-manno-octulosonic-acid transferase